MKENFYPSVERKMMKNLEVKSLMKNFPHLLVKFKDGELGVVDALGDHYAFVYVPVRVKDKQIREIRIFNLTNTGQGVLVENTFVAPKIES